jgi:DNA-directed RNA polymerase
MDERARTRRRFDRQNRGRPFTATAAGRSLLADAVPTLAAYMASEEAPKPPRGLGAVIRHLPRETLALVALDAFINRVVDGWEWHDESAEMKLAMEVGRDLRDECEMQRLLEPDTVDHTRVMASSNRGQALWRYRTLDWGNDKLVRAGAWLIQCAAALDIFDTEYRRVGRNILEFPKIADGHWEAIEALREELALKRPYYLPHTKPPPDWTSCRSEYGDDRMPAPFVRDQNPDTVAAVRQAFEDGSIREHAEGVSNVQRVPWIINEAMLPVVEKLACDVDKRFKALGDHDRRVFRAALRRDVALARHLSGEPFWTPYNVDFRGRLNPLPHFHIGREDRVRSLFMFANGQKAGDGVSWLEIAVANAAGQKGTWPKRHDWVHEHRDLTRRVARNPFGTVEHWKDFKDPFQFVAACKELVAAQNNPDFITHLPVFLDGTSNGIQHLALMTRDEEAGRLVNLTDTDERYDLYGALTERVIEMLRASADKRAKWWLIGERVTRNLLKQPVMTFSYGVTEEGVRRQIIEAYKEDHELHEPQPWHVAYLAKTVLAATAEILKRPSAAMAFMCGLTEGQAKQNLPLTWISLTGLPIISNRCYAPNTKLVEIKLKRRRVYLVADGRKDEIVPSEAVNDGPANFTHSMDASHLCRWVNAAVREGITDFAVIHDCYGSLAPQVQRFHQIGRREMALMYLCYDALLRLWHNNGRHGEPPEMGKLDLFEVQRAEYAFT